MPQFPKSCLVKWLGENISKLLLCTYIRQVNITSSDMIPDEVMPDFNMLRLVMLHWIVGYLNSTLVVTQERDFAKVDTIVPQSLLHIKQLCTTACCWNILRFSGWEGDTILLLGRPTYQGSTKKVASPCCWLASNFVTSPISIWLSNEIKACTFWIPQTKIWGMN